MENEAEVPVLRKAVPFVVTICSGKGGVGKSVMAANIAYLLSKLNYSVLLWDADKYFPNQHLLLGVEPPVRLFDVYTGSVTVDTAIYGVYENFSLLADMPAAMHGEKFDDNEIINTYRQIINLTDFDFIIIDTPAGLSYETLQCANLSDLNFVVINDEPTSLLDGYALIKVLMKHISIENINLLVNNVIDGEDAEDISTKLNLATEKFLGTKFEVIGFIPYDRAVRQSIIGQELFVISQSDSELSNAVQDVVNKISQKVLKANYFAG